MEDSIPLEANPACEQDNNTDLIQIKESPKAEVLQGQQDKDQWATREDLYTITEMLCKKTKTLNYTHNIVAKVRKHTVSQQLLTLDRLQNHIGNCWRQPAHEARDCRANKAFSKQNQRKEHSQRFNIQQTLSPDLTSHQQKHKIHHHKATPDVMMGKNNNQAKISHSHLNTT